MNAGPRLGAMLPGMVERLASMFGILAQLQGLVTAGVLAAFFALATRSLILLLSDRGCGSFAAVSRAAAGAAFLLLGSLYFVFTAHVLVWDAPAVVVAVLAVAATLSGIAMRRVTGGARRAARPGLVAGLAQLSLMLALLLLAAITLMRAGFLALTEDRPVLLVDVTGETALQKIQWAPPDQPSRDETLLTHQVVFRTPEGVAVAEAWVYGDQVAVKGRVLRLSPILNAAGVPNLFELLFAHNGYLTAERHDRYPHKTVRLPPSGPLAVHPWWRSLQSRLLERWEKGTTDESAWAIRSASLESTYFSLLDTEGKPVSRTYRLVLTPGGLTSS